MRTTKDSQSQTKRTVVPESGVIRGEHTLDAQNRLGTDSSETVPLCQTHANLCPTLYPLPRLLVPLHTSVHDTMRFWTNATLDNPRNYLTIALE